MAASLVGGILSVGTNYEEVATFNQNDSIDAALGSHNSLLLFNVGNVEYLLRLPISQGLDVESATPKCLPEK